MTEVIDNPSKILDHKWLDPECISAGCQSLAWKSRYESAVKGRQDFREAFREMRAQRDRFIEALRNLTNEVSGLLSAYEPELREACGHTNYNCVALRRDEARATLEQPANDRDERN